uniref:Mitochondrial import inner membrane translocase subunit Tim21 n=1 Tax=Anthurium amnicola TaxID=1678845 RepID=A0A1D1ZBB7_9ARAE
MLRRSALGALRGRASGAGAALWQAAARGLPPVASLTAAREAAAASLPEAGLLEGGFSGSFPAAVLMDFRQTLTESNKWSQSNSNANWMNKGISRSRGIFVPFISHSRQYMNMVHSHDPRQLNKVYGRHCTVPCFIRTFTSTLSSHSSERTTNEESRKDLATSEDPFDAPTYNIPEKPVTFAEGASYSIVILIGLGIAAAAAFAVFKELIFEPKEYKIYGKALERVQNDSQVRVRIGSPVTGYGQESRNRAARQRISHKTWTDEDGVEHIEVNFYVRGPHGAGKVYSEMFRDKIDKQWKFTYLIVDIVSPSKAQLMLESYIPA